MSYTKEYLEWLIHKYGSDDEDLNDLLERMGEKTKSFSRAKEFAWDVLAEAVERARRYNQPPKWDAFMSYAGEDKDMVVTPLMKYLHDLGLKIWFDNERYPDSDEKKGLLYRYIHEGIVRSRVGIVVVSPEYVVKEWTTQEYFGLQLKGRSKLFLVLHNVTSNTLNDLDAELAKGIKEVGAGVASTAKNSIKEIAQQITGFVEAGVESDKSEG
jgi:TIR domain